MSGPEVIVRSAEASLDDGCWTPAVMIARLGGDGVLARQLAALFVAECPRMVAEIRESIASGSGERIRRAAHALKGSVSNFTTGAPVVTAQALELAGREGRLHDVPALMQRLAHELDTLVPHLAAFAREQPCGS